jgi:hypothetical protein
MELWVLYVLGTHSTTTYITVFVFIFETESYYVSQVGLGTL